MRFAAEWRRAFLMFSASALALCMLQMFAHIELYIRACGSCGRCLPSTVNRHGTAGVPVFLANMAFSAWIKFVEYPPAAVLMAAILALGLLYLAFVHARWVHHVSGTGSAGRVDREVSVSMLCNGLG